MKVLLVKDSKFLRVATEQALTSAGYEVVSASDGDQAVRLAREHTHALILLDVMLPKNGREGRAKNLEERSRDSSDSGDDVDRSFAEKCNAACERRCQQFL